MLDVTFLWLLLHLTEDLNDASERYPTFSRMDWVLTISAEACRFLFVWIVVRYV